MLLLGIDLGTSSIKVSVMDASNGKVLASAQHPETEAAIISHQPGWAEQSPNMWWQDVQAAILKVNATGAFNRLILAPLVLPIKCMGSCL
jgi:xylulokinase